MVVVIVFARLLCSGNPFWFFGCRPHAVCNIGAPAVQRRSLSASGERHLGRSVGGSVSRKARRAAPRSEAVPHACAGGRRAVPPPVKVAALWLERGGGSSAVQCPLLKNRWWLEVVAECFFDKVYNFFSLDCSWVCGGE